MPMCIWVTLIGPSGRKMNKTLKKKEMKLEGVLMGMVLGRVAGHSEG